MLLSPRRDLGEFKKRYKWMALFVVVVFLLLIARLIMLQVVQHDRWSEVGRRNITRTIWLRATRGLLRDVQGREIASSRPSYDLYVVPEYLLDRTHSTRQVDLNKTKQIADLLGLDNAAREAMHQRILAVPERRLEHQVLMFSDITRNQMAALETHRLELPMIDVIDSPVRLYPFGSLGAHAIGYLNEVNAEDLDRLKGQDYRAGDTIGRSGIEQSMESVLRGRRGYRRVIRGSSERRELTQSLGLTTESRQPEPGHDIVLTLDMELMRSAHRAFRGQPSGAAVVVDVNSGRIRALYSKPSYDLNEMSLGMSQDAYNELLNDPFRPLIDKSIYETYFPGSTFKPITSLAGLGDHVIDPNNTVECQGYYQIGPQRMRCTGVHGHVNMNMAMVQSCNIYFWKIAEQIGLDRLNRYAHAFGFGERSGIGINAEAQGFLASRQWYEENYGRFKMGFTLNTAIGQGNTRVTLVQLALAYAAMANGGTLYVPQLVERIEASDGTVIEEMEPHVRRQIDLSSSAFTYNQEALAGVVNREEGTAYGARIDSGITVAGKTGTAQVAPGLLRRGVDPNRAWYFFQSHAWFAGYAPVENPQIAVVVLVEHGGLGGRIAAPIAIQMIQDYLRQRTQSDTQRPQGSP